VTVSPDQRTTIRDLAIALSLANLWHLRHWSWLLNANNGYYRAQPPHWSMAATSILGMLGIATMFFLAARAVRRARRPWLVETTRVLFIFVCLLSLNAARHQATRLTFEAVAAAIGRGPVLGLSILLAVAVIATLVIASWRRAASCALAYLVLCFVPLVPVTVGQALWAIARYEPVPKEFRDRPAAKMLPPRGEAAPRVVVMVFDGLDQVLAFDDRPSDLELPELARLAATCVRATNAYPPASRTALSLPAYTTGLQIARARFAGANDLALTIAPDGRRALWGRIPNVAARARELGVASALVGWYHPYCRVLGASLASCAAYQYLPPPEYSAAGNLRRHLSLLLETVPGSIRFDMATRVGLDLVPPAAQRRWHLAQYRAVAHAALAAATDTRFGLVFVHYPIPHTPYIYDRRTASADVVGPSTYIDNLALTDRAVGDMRAALERARLWDGTTLIITSDHWYRDSYGPLWQPALVTIGDPRQRVPFLVKTAHGRDGRTCNRIFRSYRMQELVLAVLAGTVRDAASVGHWIEDHSEDPPR
jgi:hypothetical protein